MTDMPPDSDTPLDPMAQQPGESRASWKDRTFAAHYAMGARKLQELIGHIPAHSLVGAEVRLKLNRSKTNTFRDELLGYTSLTHTPIYYVGYNEPSKEDESWSLTVKPIRLTPRTHIDTIEPTHLQVVWNAITDLQAKLDYPIFNELMAERNWAPLIPLPMTHTY